jgi:hypothetical protein
MKINIQGHAGTRFFFASFFYGGMLLFATIGYFFNKIGQKLERIGNKVSGGELIAK